MTDGSNDPDEQSEHGETPDQPSSEEAPVDGSGTGPGSETEGTDTGESEDAEPSSDSGGSNGTPNADEDGTDADTDAADIEGADTDPDEERTANADSDQDSLNGTPEPDPDPSDGPRGNGPADDDDTEWTQLGYVTAIGVPIAGVVVVIILFAFDVDPRDALLIGFAYLSLVTVGTGVYVFGNELGRQMRLLRTTGGFAAALLSVSVIVVLTADTDLLEFAPVVSQPVPLFIYVYAVAGALGYVFTVVGEERLNASSDSESEDTTNGSATEQTTLPRYFPENNTTGDSTEADTDETDGPIEASKIYDWSIRVFAAIPLAAAVYLLASLLLPQSQFGDPEVVVRTADSVVSVNETGVSGQLNENSSVRGVDVERQQSSDRLLAGLALLTGLFVNTAYTRLHDLAVRLLSSSRKGGNGDSE